MRDAPLLASGKPEGRLTQEERRLWPWLPPRHSRLLLCEPSASSLTSACSPALCSEPLGLGLCRICPSDGP